MEIDFSSQPPFSPSVASLDRICGFFVPGGPVRTDFVPADATGLKRTLPLSCPGDLPTPLASVTELSFFLWPNDVTGSPPLPPDQGLMIYWQISGLPDPAMPNVPPPCTGFELLGWLTADRPSQIFRTGWSEHEQLLDIMSSKIPVIVTVGISLEPLESIQNVQVVHGRVENRLVVAQKIAADLFRFMRSFDTSSGGGGQMMLVPNNVFDRWMKRFEDRFRRDPNFFLKSQEDM